MRVVWSASRGEFSIGDYYYFSKLTRIAENEGLELAEEKVFSKLGDYDLIIFNYPEIKFSASDLLKIKKWVKMGKKIVLATYYLNTDRVAENVNRVLRFFGLRVNYDLIKDEERNAGDPMFPMAKCGDLEVVMPCSASVSGGESFIVGRGVFGSKAGGVLALGTCVFWDNYSIGLANNKELAIKILRGEF
ncbi:MAG: hypothetical protein DSO01_02680 [Archaeoglobi archaeon]|jgi:hypothetical protein|nr:MAG: hypothetical protein DSO01_02680 [Archaeoglobi archaeon]TDA28806.1 MAG: hypothetical protein DSN99_01385 [Archaeoglobi archaeon]